MEDMSGRRYSTAEFDTLMPLLNFRQLMKDGMLPDSICGVSAEPRNLMLNSVVFRYNPTQKLRPTAGLYGMLETMPTRVGLTQPTDMFRIADRIEFIDAQSNAVDQDKSARFQRELEKRGFEFPAQWAVGDASTRKSYDEGYFTLDNNGDLFHIKMVNGRPFVKNTQISGAVDGVALFAPYYPSNKRFYGYVVADGGEMFMLGSDDAGGYVTTKLDIGTIDMEREQVVVMGNILYWTISVQSDSHRRYYALKSDDLTAIATHRIDKRQNLWDSVSSYLMPFTIAFKANNSEYIYPRVAYAGWKALVVSFILALLVVFVLCSKESIEVRLFKFVLVALSGIAGLIAIAILPKFVVRPKVGEKPKDSEFVSRR